MWEGFQEYWRHEVPKDANLIPHPLSGDGRLSFTFRKRKWDVSKRAPLCHCGKKTMLKPVFTQAKGNMGRYFWSCQNPRVGGPAGRGRGGGKGQNGQGASWGGRGEEVNIGGFEDVRKIVRTESSTYSSCEFFKWDDEVLAELRAINANGKK